MRNAKIRTKITLWFALVLALVIGITVALLFSVGETVARDGARTDLKEVVTENGGQVRYTENPSRIDPHASVIPWGSGTLVVKTGFLDQFNGVDCGLYDAQGQMLFGQKMPSVSGGTPDFQDGKLRTVQAGKKHYYLLDRAVKIDGQGEVWIRGVIDREYDRELFLRVYRLLYLFLPVLVLLASLAVFRIARRLLSPVEDIAEEVGHISRETDLSRRVSIDTGDNEIRSLVQAINGMLERLEGSYRSGKQFTSLVSHELRTPITVILAQSELALEEDPPEEAREAFEIIQKQGRRVNKGLDSLLQFIRLENLAEVYEMEEVNLSRVVTDTCREFHAVREKNIRLQAETEEDVRIRGNASLLRVLLENLIVNAYKYGVEDGVIRVSVAEESGEAVLSVSDDGIGVAPEDRERIFEWLYQANPTTTPKGGSGYGLFIVRAIAELHGARMELDSAVGEGSTFRIRFPALQAAGLP
ncbi:MAG: HAMP domain-containing histidine kinase [Firmicutes bacterium]|nr:HAMP domain-containing histidine kinase [Bacillota bacterium]